MSVPWNTYKTLRDKHGLHSSWTIWTNPDPRYDPPSLTRAGIGDVSFFQVGESEYEPLGQALRRDAVIVGLNPAKREGGTDTRPFGTFHYDDTSRGWDHVLRHVTYHHGLWGAFATDLSATVETNSGLVTVTPEDAATFAARLDDLGAEPGVRIVALGDRVRDALATAQARNALAHLRPDYRRIHHYSDHGRRGNPITRRDHMAEAASVLGVHPVDGLWVP